MTIPKLGCIIRPEVKAMHAALAVDAKPLLPAWSRIVGTPRICAGNNSIGDCAVVAAINAVQTRLSRQGNFRPIPDALGPEIYSAVTGYTPLNPATDRGTDPEQLFAWWQVNPIAGHKLRGFTRINPANTNALRNAITGLGAYLCVELAVEQQGKSKWTPAGTPGTWGGHAVWSDDYEANYFQATSWGQAIQVDEAYLTGGYAVAAYSLDLVVG